MASKNTRLCRKQHTRPRDTDDCDCVWNSHDHLVVVPGCNLGKYMKEEDPILKATQCYIYTLVQQAPLKLSSKTCINPHCTLSPETRDDIKTTYSDNSCLLEQRVWFCDGDTCTSKKWVHSSQSVLLELNVSTTRNMTLKTK